MTSWCIEEWQRNKIDITLIEPTLLWHEFPLINQNWNWGGVMTTEDFRK